MAGKASKTVPFNDLAIAKFIRDAAKAGKELQRRVADVPGLSIVVKASGSASYVVQYHVGKGNKRQLRKTALGQYGCLRLVDAKIKALEIVQGKARGADPIRDERTKAKAVAASLSLRQLWELRIKQDDSIAPGSIEKYQFSLDADVFPTLGDTPAKMITSDMLVSVLTVVEARSKYTAHNVRSALSGTYRWGMQRLKVHANPVSGLGFNYTSKRRKRRASDDELMRLWAALESPDFKSEEGTKIALKLAVLLGQRGGEMVAAEISELQLEGPAPRWTPPAHRMKRKSDDDVDTHIIPLSQQAVELFRRAVQISHDRRDGVHVFPGYMVGRHGKVWQRPHLSRHGAGSAMRDACTLAGIKDLRVHDMRKVLVTWLGERFERPDVLDRILHHAPRGVTAQHYDFSTLEGPLRSAFQRWADHVWSVTGQTVATSNVVPMKASA